MVLDDNDLIQANATIISGVLILLTLTSLSGTFVTDSSSSLPLLDRLMIASAIIPFIASTILLLNLRLNEAKRSDYARKLTNMEIDISRGKCAAFIRTCMKME
jgi:type IV secretory pathway VirB4 component